MRYYISITSLFLGLILFSTSCKENSTAINQDSTQNEVKINEPVVLNNSLSFDSRNDFNSFIQELQQIPENELNEFMQNKFGDFTSLRRAQNQLMKSKSSTDESSDILQLDIQDPNFASIVNENGVFQIEEQVFKITNSYTYIFKNSEAFETFEFAQAKLKSSSYMMPEIVLCEEREMIQVMEDVYRVDNCGGGGGGGYIPDNEDEDNSYPNQDVLNLDPNANLDIDYPSYRTQEYRSSGTKGRLKGKSWNQNFYVYSSVGTKTEHQRHTWGRWWDREAEQITLESFIEYSYGEKLINPTELTQSLKVKLSEITSLIQGGVEYFLQRTINLPVGGELTEKVWSTVKNKEFTIKTQKVQDDRFTYDIYPSDLVMTYSHSKSNAKRIKAVADWSTAIIAFPPKIKETSVEFKLELIRAKHTLKHDGYHLGFITDKRE